MSGGTDTLQRFAVASGSTLDIFDGGAAEGTDVEELDFRSGLSVTVGTSAAGRVRRNIALNNDVPRFFNTGFAATTADGNNFIADITHGLNNMHPVVTVYDNNNRVILPMEITATGTSTIRLTFPVNTVTGRVSIVG